MYVYVSIHNKINIYNVNNIIDNSQHTDKRVKKLWLLYIYMCVKYNSMYIIDYCCFVAKSHLTLKPCLTLLKPHGLEVKLVLLFPCYSQEHILRSLAPKELFPLGYLLRIYMLYSVYVCVCMPAKSLQSCTTLCNPMDCSPPVSLVHGVLQARILEWVAISSYRGSSLPRDQTCISCIGRRILLTEPPGKPILYSRHIIYIHVHGESHGQGSLEGYSSWGHKESDMT